MRVVGRPDTVRRATGDLRTPLGVPSWIGDDEDVATTPLAVAIDDTCLDRFGDGSTYDFVGRDGVGDTGELVLEGLADGAL